MPLCFVNQTSSRLKAARDRHNAMHATSLDLWTHNAPLTEEFHYQRLNYFGTGPFDDDLDRPLLVDRSPQKLSFVRLYDKAGVLAQGRGTWRRSCPAFAFRHRSKDSPVSV
jgi:hypothetical protein